MSSLKIGWASRDISTDKAVNILGQFHMRISQGVLDPLSVTALVLDKGTDQVIFLSADLAVIRFGLLDEIRKRVEAKTAGIPVAKILMNATHTHSAPSHYADTRGDNWTGASTAAADDFPHPGITIASSDQYRSFLADQAAEAIVSAWQQREAAGLAYGYAYAVSSHSRRAIYADDVSLRPGARDGAGYRVDGHAVMYGDTSDAQFSHYEAGADPFINLLFTFDRAGEISGAIINLPAPSQNSEHSHLLSADFWHDVRQLIHQQYGCIFLLPQCAAAGDLSPRILHYKAAQARRFALKYGLAEAETELAARRDLAERIVQAFSECLDWARRDIRTDLPLRHLVETVELSKRLITDEEADYARRQLAELNRQSFMEEGESPRQILEFNSSLAARRIRFERILERYVQQADQPYLPMELHVLRLGEIAFASNRFELYMDYMHRIQARSPFIQTFIIQLAGTPGPDGGSYLATERAVANRGYGASMFDNLLSPAGGQELVEKTLELLEKLHSS